MNTFDESKVRRDKVGRFDFQPHAEGEVDLLLEETEPVEEVRYSFVENFEDIEKQFEADFEGYPSRFFNADLRGRVIPRNVESSDLSAEIPVSNESQLVARYLNNAKAAQRLAQGASAPQDLAMPDVQVEETARELGITDLQRVVNLSVVKLFGRNWEERTWVGTLNGKQIIITDGAVGVKNFSTYRMRHGGVKPREDMLPLDSTKDFAPMDVRTLAGAARVKRKTGFDLAELSQKVERDMNTLPIGPDGRRIYSKENIDQDQAAKVARAIEILRATEALEDAQREGQNFLAQKKYLKENTGKIATAWMDKKDTDELHKRLAEESVLNDSFAKIELDNDVTEEEFADFEKAWQETKDMLPPIPKGLEPTLRIRKLGKHRANGIYFPTKNTVGIDVRTSEATVHEMAHYFDLAVNNNASLSAPFRSVVTDYTKNLRMPPDMTSKSSYYSTPTEIFARGYELYAHERLGVNNRLVRPDKFDRFDYAPFQQNPEMKERMFRFFDDNLKK